MSAAYSIKWRTSLEPRGDNRERPNSTLGFAGHQTKTAFDVNSEPLSLTIIPG
jgi:hypothetical protein